mgnify:CR=1 FL=1
MSPTPSPEDELSGTEQPFVQHLIELRDRLLYSVYGIALAVIVENATFGGAQAAPIARRVFDYWLLDEYPSEEAIAAVRKGLATAPIGTPRRALDMLPTAEQ